MHTELYGSNYINLIKMKKIKSFSELKSLRDKEKEKLRSYGTASDPDNKIIIRVGMGTSGLASGARGVMDFLQNALIKRNIEAIVMGAGDMGYSYAEPTIQVTKPGCDPVVFGDVDTKRADDIIEKYIKMDEPVEGIIPVDYLTIDEI